MQWLGENLIPFSIIFTKADKLKPKAIEKNVTKYCEKLMESWEELPPKFINSSLNRTGVEEVLKYIDALNKELKGIRLG